MSEKNRQVNIGDGFSDSPTIIGKEAKDIISAAEGADSFLENTIRINVSENGIPNDSADEDTEKTQRIDLSKETKKKEDEVYENNEETRKIPVLMPDDDEEDDFSPIRTVQDEKECPQKEKVNENKEKETNTKKDENPKRKKIHGSYKRFASTLAIVLGVLVAICAVLFFIGYSTIPSNKSAGNVYIGDVYVGNMTYDEILANIKDTHLFAEQQVTLRCRGENFEINGSDIGLVANPEDTARKAFEYTKSENKFINGLQNAVMIFKKHTIVPVAVVDKELLANKINEFGVHVFGELVEHTLVVQANNTVLITPGHTGYDNNPIEAVEEVLVALANEKFRNINVSALSSCPPADLTPESVDAQVYMEAKDAKYEYDGDAVNVVPEVEGRYINKEEIAPLIANVKEGTDPIEIPWYSQPAQVKAQDLQDKLFADVLSTYSTDYGSSGYNRSMNVSRAAELLNGAVIAPGDTFSFNSRVGDRTEANGFYTASEYSGGQTVQGIGGGTCQVSTTLYCAALYADMNIVSRTNHMFTISYAPLGQDATVAYGSVDFKFLNSSEYPVKISAYTEDGAIFISILGTAWPDGRTVKIKNNVSYGTGTSVTSVRYVYVDDECMSEDTLPSSYYKPRNTATSAPAAN